METWREQNVRDELNLKSQSAAVNLTQCLAARASGRIQKEAEHDSHNDGIVGKISLFLIFLQCGSIAL